MRVLTWVMLFMVSAVLLSSCSVQRVYAQDDASAADIEADVDDVDEEEMEIGEEEDQEPAEEEPVDDDEEEYEGEFADDEEHVLGPSPDVSASYIFPDYEGTTLEIGEKVTVLAVLSNTGDETFDLTEMGAFLHSNYDHTYYIQNYTKKNPAAVLEPGQQVSLQYDFYPNERLEPESFHLSAYVQYNDTDDEVFRNTFFNQSIVLVEKPKPFDFAGAISYLLGLAIVGGFAYYVVSNNVDNSASNSTHSKKGAKAAPIASNDSADDWGTIYQPKPSKKGSSKKGKKNN